MVKYCKIWPEDDLRKAETAILNNQYCHFQDNCCVYRRTII